MHCNRLLNFKDSSTIDIPFYKKMILNKEWTEVGGFSIDDFSTIEKIKNYLTCKCDVDLKVIVSLISTKEKIGYCHFQKKDEESVYMVGGILPKYWNSGYGLYALVLTLDFYFTLRLVDKIKSSILDSNERSMKIHKKVGFKKIGISFIDDRKYEDIMLSKDDFYNIDFVKIILHRFNVRVKS